MYELLWDQAFDERLLVHLSIIIVLHCIDHKAFKHLNIIWHRYIVVVTTDIYIVLCKQSVMKASHYKLPEFHLWGHININICTNLPAFRSVWACECFWMSVFPWFSFESVQLLIKSFHFFIVFGTYSFPESQSKTGQILISRQMLHSF